jgi:Secretion system C-terminal sorting domain
VRTFIFNIIIVLVTISCVQAQEYTGPLLCNDALFHTSHPIYKKSRTVNLPFIDDFYYTGPYPSATYWTDDKAFINNTFGVSPVTQGVATFDALNAQGLSYHTNGLPGQYYADSLTSVAINLGSNTSADSIYLSFFVQAQGRGFKPETSDSLMLFFLDNNNKWIKVWSQQGSTLTMFNQILLPISNGIFLHNAFQFRFINIASPNSNDDVWNIDYVRLDKNRNYNDVNLNDVAFSDAPTGILKNYTSMPYRHFLPFRGQELAADYKVSVMNNTINNVAVGANMSCKDIFSNTSVYGDNVTINMPPNTNVDGTYVDYIIGAPTPATYPAIVGQNPVTLRHTYTYGISPGTVNTLNDTIVQDNIFSNYFAYDDGSCEKAYYLYATPNYKASVAIAFHLNIADTVQGLGIKFAQQVPGASGKHFNIVLYKNLNTSTATQQILKQQDSFVVQYEPTQNGISTYKFKEPIGLDSGTYYIGITQEPNTESDTIYFGLDVNTIKNPTYAYYNVDGQWNQSGIQGAVMLRPIVGNGTFTPTAITTSNVSSKIGVFPNPSSNTIYISSTQEFNKYAVTNALGKIVLQKENDNAIDITTLIQGIYYLNVFKNNILIGTSTFIKQ